MAEEIPPHETPPPQGIKSTDSELGSLLESIMNNYAKEAQKSKLTPETKVQIVREYLKELFKPEDGQKK